MLCGIIESETRMKNIPARASTDIIGCTVDTVMYHSLLIPVEEYLERFMAHGARGQRQCRTVPA